MTAFLTLEIRQGAGHETVAEHLAAIPEVLEAFTITGAGDMWARVVARSNTDLQRVIDQVLRHAGIVRSTTVIALATQIPFRCCRRLSSVVEEALGVRPAPSGDAVLAVLLAAASRGQPHRAEARASIRAEMPTQSSSVAANPCRSTSMTGTGTSRDQVLRASA